ncbi:MAG: penicillin acylase family protein [Acidimicrobiales bacterium]
MTEPRSLTRRVDRWGISHLDAPDALAVFWGQGWAAANDRLWQMEWDRRRGQGRWAEVVGPAGVAEDVFFRRFGLADAARAQWSLLAPATRRMTEAYAAGVNGWLGTNRERLPVDLAAQPEPPEPWAPWHCLLVYQVRHLFMGSLTRKLYRALVADAAGAGTAVATVTPPGARWATPMIPRDRVTPTPPAGTAAGDAAGVDGQGTAWAAEVAAGRAALTGVTAWLEALNRSVVVGGVAAEVGPDVDAAAGGGSNSWALAPSRTATGAPLLAGDPHRGIEFPNTYHQVHLRCDRFDAIGLAFPGVPGLPHFGHNDRVAWCITHGMADDTDLFVEDGPVVVLGTETVTVAGAPAVTVTRARTGRGPVVLGEPGGDGPVLSMAWTAVHDPGRRGDTTFDCLWSMLEASDVDGFEAAMGDWVLPVNNLLTADVDGSIALRIRGRIVQRPVANRWGPVPGDADHGWAEQATTVPDDALPRWRDPRRGFLVTANNPLAAGGPYVSLDFADSPRHDRIVQLLEPITGATAADMSAVHADTVSLRAHALLPVLATASPTTDAGRRALGLLAGWDADLTLDSAPAAVYGLIRAEWSDEVARRLGLRTDGVAGWPTALGLGRMLHDDATALLARGRWGLILAPGEASPPAEILAEVLGAVVDRAAARLVARFGPDPAGWAWGPLHPSVNPHPLVTAGIGPAGWSPPADPCPGDGDTVRCASVNPAAGTGASVASVARYVFDLADWDRSGWVVPHGVSGVPGGGHDRDQRSAWLATELLPMAYTPAAVAAVTTATETLTVPADVPSR